MLFSNSDVNGLEWSERNEQHVFTSTTSLFCRFFHSSTNRCLVVGPWSYSLSVLVTDCILSPSHCNAERNMKQTVPSMFVFLGTV